jgi:hypothetical protein
VIIRFIAFLVAVLLGAIVLTIGAISLIRRNRDRVHGSGSLGNAMRELEGLFVESKAHVLKVDRAEEAEAGPAAGDPPEK